MKALFYFLACALSMPILASSNSNTPVPPLQVGPQLSATSSLVTAQFQTNITSMSINQNGTKELSKPGHYYLSDNCAFSPVTGAAQDDTMVFYITSSNVTLDLNRKMLTQANNTLNVTAIVIAPGVSHVTITNGFIKHFSGLGIAIQEGCSHITLENLHISDCAMGGIEAVGSFDTPIKNFKMINVLSSNHTGDTAAFGGDNTYDAYAATLEYVDNAQLHSCGFNHCSSADGASIALIMTFCKNASVINSQAMLNESSTDAVGMFFILCDTLTLFNCTSTQNKSNTGNVFGFYIMGCSNSKMYNCFAESNQAELKSYGFAFVGFLSDNEDFPGYFGSNHNNIQHCQSSYNIASSGSSYGFYSAGNTGNNFLQCVAQGNLSGTDDETYAAGFFAEGLVAGTLHDESFLTIENCLSKAHFSQNGTGGGIIIDEVVNAYINNNWVINNTGTAQCYGVADLSLTQTRALIVNNKAYGNGGDTGNNFFATHIESNAQIPVIYAATGDFRALHSASPYTNIAWDDLPTGGALG